MLVSVQEIKEVLSELDVERQWTDEEVIQIYTMLIGFVEPFLKPIFSDRV
jgi:hypothetical protein